MAGYDGRGQQFPLVIPTGADLAFTLTVTDSADAAIDVSGATIAGELYNAVGTVVDTLSAAVSGAGSNVITLSLTDTETALLSSSAVKRWTLWVTRGGDKRPWLAGKVDIVAASSPKSTAGSSTTLVVDSDVNVAVSVDVVGGVPLVGNGGFAALRGALDAEVPTAVGVVGDSTGNDPSEWVYLLGERLADAYPDYNVNYWTWGTSEQEFTGYTAIQAGPDGDRHVEFNGAQRAYVPDSADVSITGDLEIITHVSLDDWTPAAEQTIVGKFAGAGQRSWQLYVDQFNAGRPTFRHTVDGSTLITANCPSGQGWVAPSDGDAIWLRVRLDVDNGASQHVVTFATATTYGTWTTVGTVTAAGATSVFDSTAEVMIGARGALGGEGAYLSGKVYHVEVRDGIGGFNVVPVNPELWPNINTGFDVGGSPTLSIVSASHPGAHVTYLMDATRIKKMTPNFGQALTILSTSHNDLTRRGAEWLADMDTLRTRISARLPSSVIGVCTQNPRTPPASNISSHALRNADLAGWAARNNLTLIPAYGAFVNDGRPLSSLVDSDGVHPTAAGSALWADVAMSAYTARA